MIEKKISTPPMPPWRSRLDKYVIEKSADLLPGIGWKQSRKSMLILCGLCKKILVLYNFEKTCTIREYLNYGLI